MLIPVYAQTPNQPENTSLLGRASDKASLESVANRFSVSAIGGSIKTVGGVKQWRLVATILPKPFPRGRTIIDIVDAPSALQYLEELARMEDKRAAHQRAREIRKCIEMLRVKKA